MAESSKLREPPIPATTPDPESPHLQPAETSIFEEAPLEAQRRSPLSFDPEERARLRKANDAIPRDVGAVNLDLPLSCGLTRREIEQMKAAGIEQPSWIRTSEWIGPMKLSHRHQLIAHLAALGMRPREICAATGVSSQWLGVLLQQPAIKERIEIIRSVELRGLGIDKRLEMLAPKALRTYEDLLDNPLVRDTVKGMIARDIFDRRFGKPVQKVEMGGSLIRDLIELAKLEQKEVKVIPTTSDAVFEEIPQKEFAAGTENTKDRNEPVPVDTQQVLLDNIDEWLNENFDTEKK